MGWASGTEVFVRMADAILTCTATKNTKRALLIALIDTLEENDWDCLYEVAEDHPLIQEAVNVLHPDWDWET